MEIVPSALRRRVLLSSTMLVAAVVGYGRRAYGACVFTGGSSYVCSGANVTTQTITANDATVSTVAGFSVNAAAGNAITITGDGALSYTDTNASPLTAPATALYVKSTGDDGLTPGSVTIDTNGALSGNGYGIKARNNGTGALTITANGNVTGTGEGIHALNSGTDLIITTGAGTTVSGGDAIEARNFGTGALTITANGNVTGTSGDGIIAYNSAASTGDLSVTTAAGTTVSGLIRGIDAHNSGSGALTIKAYGNVTGTNSGIYANNSAAGTGLSVTTGTGTTVSGVSYGIKARNYGTGALTITANGNVTGTYSRGIYANNSAAGTNLTVTTAAGTTVSGFIGAAIDARNHGTGALTVTVNGNLTSAGSDGIFAGTYAASTGNLSVTTAAGTTVSGFNRGIAARNFGHGALTITAYGNVTGTGKGIYANNSAAGTGLSVTTGTGTTVSGGSFGILAINHGTGALTVTANGNVTSAYGVGIYARNYAASTGDLTVTTGGTVSGGTFGIQARNNGTGALTITANGNVTGTGTTGIYAYNSAAGTDLTVTTAAGTTVSGGPFGIFARNLGTGALTIKAYGNVTGTSSDGIYAGAGFGGGAIAITVAATGTVTSANAFAIKTVGGPATVTVAGTVAGSMQLGGAGSTLTFLPGAVYKVFVNGATASLATVNGTATLAGTVNASFQGGSSVNTTYTILTATGLGGTRFTGVSSPNFATSLSYSLTDVSLTLNAATLGAGTPLSPGQQNVANAINSYLNNGGALSPGFATVFGLTGGALTNALTQLSGQPGASTAQAGLTGMGQFINGVFDGAFGDGPGQGGATGFAEENAYAAKPKVSREAKDAYAAVTPRDRRAPSFEQRWAVWASVYGGNSRVNGDSTAGTSTTTSRTFGTAAGASYRFTPDTLAGFALGGAGSSFSLDGGFGGGKADVFNAAFYAKHNIGAAYVAGLLGYSWQDTTTDRTVTISGTDQLHASFKAQALAARLEGGWRYAAPMVGVTPYAALQSTSFYLPGYGETATSGSSTFALSYASKTVTATRSELGAKFDKAMLVQGGTFTLKARTAWAHDWNTDRAATATFQTLPGATFTTNGAQPSANAALVSLGGEMSWHNGWTLAANFDGEFSRTTAAYTGKGSIRYAW